jgi:hypothetical protein
MPHAIVVDGSRIAVRDVVEVKRHGRAALRFQPLAGGDLAVVAPHGGWIDGRPILGGLATVDWGAGALLRADGRAIEVRWEASRETRVTTAVGRCALCFGSIARGEATTLCTCATALHAECFAVMISCPSCGEGV